MPVEFYNAIKISSVYVTSDGTVSGINYISTVEGLDALQLGSTVQVTRSLSNKVFLQYGRAYDVPISITFPMLDTAMFDSIRDEVQVAITNDVTLTLDIDGATGSYDLDAVPDANPIRHPGTFQNGKILDVSFHFLAHRRE